MRTIFKYQLQLLDGEQAFAAPAGARFVHVRETETGKIELWAEVETSQREEFRTFRVFGTGHRIPDGFDYVGTAIFRDIGLVFHVYEDWT